MCVCVCACILSVWTLKGKQQQTRMEKPQLALLNSIGWLIVVVAVAVVVVVIVAACVIASI